MRFVDPEGLSDEEVDIGYRSDHEELPFLNRGVRSLASDWSQDAQIGQGAIYGNVVASNTSPATYASAASLLAK